MIEIYARDINPYTKQPRQTRIYIVEGSSISKGIKTIKDLNTWEDSWVFKAEIIKGTSILVNSWEP